MKSTLLLLTIMLIHFPMMAQNNREKIDFLVRLNYIKKSEAKELAEMLSSYVFTSYSLILFQNEFKRNFKYYYSPWNTVIWDNSEIDVKERKKCNDELAKFLDELYLNKVLTEREYRHQMNQVKNAKYFHKVQLLQDLSEQQGYEEWIRPESILQYSTGLLENRLISETSFSRLKSEIDAGHFRTHRRLYDDLENARCIDLSKYSNNPEVYLEQIHKEVSLILPELNFSDFKYEIVVDSSWSDDEYISRNVIVSINANGKNYKQKSFIALDNFLEKGSFLGKIDDQEFYQIFNKILSDNQSRLRLHRFGDGMPQYGDNVPFQYFGIIALEKDQASMFRHAGSYIEVSYENFKNRPTSSQIDKAIQEYRELGLLDHLTNEQIEHACQKVKEQDNQNLNDVISKFPNVTFHFDTELANIDNPYEMLIRGYGKITRGDFEPENISDDFDIEKGKVASLSFVFNNKSHSSYFKIQHDWIDTDFFDYTKKICQDHNLQGQFYELFTGGQGVRVIYLTPTQYEYIRGNKLLTFDDEGDFEE